MENKVGVSIFGLGASVSYPEIGLPGVDPIPISTPGIVVSGGSAPGGTVYLDTKIFSMEASPPSLGEGRGSMPLQIHGQSGVAGDLAFGFQALISGSGFGTPFFSGKDMKLPVILSGEGKARNSGIVEVVLKGVAAAGTDSSEGVGGVEFLPAELFNVNSSEPLGGFVSIPLTPITYGSTIKTAMEMASVGEDWALELLIVLADSIRAYGESSSTGSFAVEVGEDVVARAILQVPILAAVMEEVEASTTSPSDVFKMIQAVDQLVAASDSDSKASLLIAAAILLAIQDSTALTFNLSVEEVLHALSGSEASLTQKLQVLESIEALMESTTNAFLAVETGEDVTIVDEPITQARLQALIEEGAAVFVSIKVGDEDFSGWVMQTATFGFSEYTNFPFNDLVSVGGRYFGVASDGLYELEGDTDDGAAIDAHIRTGLLDMGSHFLKDAKAAYIGYNSKGEVFLKVATTMKGQKEEWWYRLKQGPAQSLRDGRVTIGRGLRAKYWQFEVANLEGADFDLDDIHIMYNVLSRRIR